jgi:hypothetical protein
VNASSLPLKRQRQQPGNPRDSRAAADLFFEDGFWFSFPRATPKIAEILIEFES